MVEGMHQAQCTPWWTVQPVMQSITRPGVGVLNSDGSLRPNAWVIAIRSRRLRLRRPVEREWDRLAEAAEAFRRGQPDISDINVGLMFHGPVPPHKQHAEFMAEVAAFIRAHIDDLASGEKAYWPPEFSTPLMRTYLRTLYLRRDRHAVWYSNLVAGFVARPAPPLRRSSRRNRPGAFAPVMSYAYCLS